MSESASAKAMDMVTGVADIHAKMFGMKYLLDDIFASDTYKDLKEENFAKNLADMKQILQDVMHSIEEMCFPEWNKPDLLNCAYVLYMSMVKEQCSDEVLKRMQEEFPSIG